MDIVAVGRFVNMSERFGFCMHVHWLVLSLLSCAAQGSCRASTFVETCSARSCGTPLETTPCSHTCSPTALTSLVRFNRLLSCLFHHVVIVCRSGTSCNLWWINRQGNEST